MIVFGLETLDDDIFLIDFFAHVVDHFLEQLYPWFVLGISFLLLWRSLFDIELPQADRFDGGASPVGRIRVFLAGWARLALFLRRLLCCWGVCYLHWESILINPQDTLIFGDRRLSGAQCWTHWPRIASGCCHCIIHSTICSRRPLRPLEYFLALARLIRYLSNGCRIHLQILILLRDQFPVNLSFGRAVFLCFWLFGILFLLNHFNHFSGNYWIWFVNVELFEDFLEVFCSVIWVANRSQWPLWFDRMLLLGTRYWAAMWLEIWRLVLILSLGIRENIVVHKMASMNPVRDNFENARFWWVLGLQYFLRWQLLVWLESPQRLFKFIIAQGLSQK